jgi:competence protein ComEC
MGSPAPVDAALQHSSWRKLFNLSSGVARLEAVLEASGFDRAPWLVVAFAGGIAAWFVLGNLLQWLALLALCGATLLGALAGLHAEGRYPFLRQALIVVPGLVMLGCLTVWGKSALIGAEPVAGPVVARFDARIVSREEQPAEDRVRLVLDTREPETGRAIRVRVNLPLAKDRAGLENGAQVRLRARLMPPAPPMLPGSYDFARTAWFNGLAGTGTVLGEVELKRAGDGGGALERTQTALAKHVRSQLGGSSGTIAAAFASGDRGAIAVADEEAMRDSGLTHLLSISGLHVSAVVAAAYVLAIRLLALWPWLALRLRLPLVAAGAGALAGIGYTLLTGAEVPTVRSCIGAVLVLIALALGREALSMRMVAVAAFAVLVLWPEAVVGPSFQMSFAAVIAIVALHGAAPIQRFLLPRAEPWWARGARLFAMLLLTGVVIEFALMPIGLFHFHRAGVYGALANVIAIPLTTFVSMPLIALALVFDAVGAGAPFWWLAGKSLDLLLGLAHWTAGRPGAVTLLPAFGAWPFGLSLAGLLWLALWRGRKRLLGLVPVAVGTLGLALASPPDVLVSGDGKHVGITGAVPGELLVLRDSRSDYARDNLTEQAGMDGALRKLDDWPGAACTREFCAVTLRRGGRDWRFLLGRGTDYVEERALAAACERADVVISDRWLPRSCRPRWFKADRALLGKTGGLAINLEAGEVSTVSERQGEHGWWREPPPRKPRPKPGATSAGQAVTKLSNHPNSKS